MSRKDMGQSSKHGRHQLITKVQKALNLGTRKEAERVIDTVIDGIEQTLVDNLQTDRFVLKLKSFGKLTVRHSKGTYRRIPRTNELRKSHDKRKVKFTTLGKLRRLEIVQHEDSQNQ